MATTKETLLDIFKNVTMPSEGLTIGHDTVTFAKDGDEEVVFLMSLPQPQKAWVDNKTFDLFVIVNGQKEYFCTCDRRRYEELLDRYGFEYPIDNTSENAASLSMTRNSFGIECPEVDVIDGTVFWYNGHRTPVRCGRIIKSPIDGNVFFAAGVSGM